MRRKTVGVWVTITKRENNTYKGHFKGKVYSFSFSFCLFDAFVTIIHKISKKTDALSRVVILYSVFGVFTLFAIVVMFL